MTSRLAACLVLTAGLAVRAGAQTSPETPAERAAKTYASAVSAMRTRQYDQAQVLFEKYVRNYATHEYVPVGYLLLGYCRLQQKDAAGCEEALDEVINRYRHSPAWYMAYASKLGRAKAAKDHEAFVGVLETFAAAAPELPLDLRGGLGLQYGQYYNSAYHGRYFEPTAAELGSVQERPGWVLRVVEAADTPERAEKVLAALARTLTRRAGELPPDWQFAHVQLLRKAGKAEEADRLLGEYLAGWSAGAAGGKDTPALDADPRGIDLHMLWIKDAAARKDTKTVDAGWASLIETYRGAGALADELYGRVAALSRDDERWDEFTKLARHFLKTYTTSRYWDSVVALWIGSAKNAAARGDTSRIDGALALLDEVYATKHPARVRRGLLWRVELKLLDGKVDEAAELARQLITQPQWCSTTFDLLADHATKHKAFAAVVDAARKEWKIPPANPTSGAFVLLNKLKLRLKDDQVRHAEEIGEELFTRHRDDASTVEAVKALADYYFEKVLPEPRDKWMGRMIETWPFHPLTEAVLKRQIVSTGAARQYKLQAQAVDRLMERFPPLASSYYNRRLQLFDKAQDPAGKLAFVKKFMGPAAAAGDVRAIAEVARYELATFEKYPELGDAWMEKAAAYPGTRTELYCLLRAWNAYYRSPHRQNRRDEIAWDKAAGVLKTLREQTLNPELSWKLTFADVHLLADQEGKAGRMLSTLKGRLKGRPKWRDLSLRLDMAKVGSALGRAEKAEKAVELARTLKGACFTRRDAGAIELLQASAWAAQEEYEKAAVHYMTVVNGSPFPSKMYPYFNTAASYLKRAGSKQYVRTMEAYMRKVSRTQELVPGLLYRLGLHHFRSRGPAALAARNRLAGRYPCSAARDRLEKHFARLRPRKRKR